MKDKGNFNNNIGAISALKGYRVQFLYSLLRILSHNEDEAQFHPEGKYEDLDIYDINGEAIEIIQVKALKKVMSLSDILVSDDNCFIRRGIKVHSNGQLPKIKLISFGEVNDDIKELRKQTFSKNFTTKLKNLKLKTDEILLLETYFDYEIVCEKDIENAVIEKIKNLGLFIDYKVALELLLYWIYYAAEKQKVIEIKNIVEQLEGIAKFQSERISFHNSFGTLIKPLNRDIENESIERLNSDFYQGISATYNHILANVDIKRFEKLNLLKKKFSESNIVFIHGASGQGKTNSFRNTF